MVAEAPWLLYTQGMFMYEETPRDLEIATIIIDQMHGPDFLREHIKMKQCWVMERGVGMLCEAGGKVKANFGYMPFPLEAYGFRVEVQLDEGQDLYKLTMHKLWYHKDCDKYIHSEYTQTSEGIYCDMLYPAICFALGHAVNKKEHDKMVDRMFVRFEDAVTVID